MASLLGNPAVLFSDSLVGRVPHLPGGRHQGGQARQGLDTTNNAPIIAPFAPRAPRRGHQAAGVATGARLSITSAVPIEYQHSADSTTKTTGKRKLPNHYRTPVRRQQCRTNQARYRDRQRNAQAQLEKSVEQLHQEVSALQRRHRDLSSRERSNQSPWSVVTEFFRLLEHSFRSPWQMASALETKNHEETQQILVILKNAFIYDTAMGELSGDDALMEQLRCYSQFFGEPRLKIQHMESMSPGVMATKASLTVTVTELTIRHVFPHLVRAGDADELHRSLSDLLLGQRLQLSCSMRFLFDDESCRVVRLETNLDLVEVLLRALGNLADVSAVVEHALITPECTISREATL